VRTLMDEVDRAATTYWPPSRISRAVVLVRDAPFA